MELQNNMNPLVSGPRTWTGEESESKNQTELHIHIIHSMEDLTHEQSWCESQVQNSNKNSIYGGCQITRTNLVMEHDTKLEIPVWFAAMFNSFALFLTDHTSKLNTAQLNFFNLLMQQQKLLYYTQRY